MYRLSRQFRFSCWRLEAANIKFGNTYNRITVCINGQLSFFRTSALKSKMLSLGDTSIFHQQTLQPTTCSSAYQKFLGMRKTVGHVINSRRVCGTKMPEMSVHNPCGSVRTK